MKKQLYFFALFLAVLCLLPACSDVAVQYKTDVNAQAVVNASSTHLPTFALLSPADADYVRYRMLLTDEVAKSYSIYIQNAGSSIDEIGVVEATGANGAAVSELVKDYLERRNAEWTGQYLVEEYPKLRDAEYRVYGKYVVYAILSEDDKAAFFQDAEKFLKAE